MFNVSKSTHYTVSLTGLTDTYTQHKKHEQRTLLIWTMNGEVNFLQYAIKKRPGALLPKYCLHTFYV